MSAVPSNTEETSNTAFTQDTVAEEHNMGTLGEGWTAQHTVLR